MARTRSQKNADKAGSADEKARDLDPASDVLLAASDADEEAAEAKGAEDTISEPEVAEQLGEAALRGESRGSNSVLEKRDAPIDLSSDGEAQQRPSKKLKSILKASSGLQTRGATAGSAGKKVQWAEAPKEQQGAVLGHSEPTAAVSRPGLESYPRNPVRDWTNRERLLLDILMEDFRYTANQRYWLFAETVHYHRDPHHIDNEYSDRDQRAAEWDRMHRWAETQAGQAEHQALYEEVRRAAERLGYPVTAIAQTPALGRHRAERTNAAMAAQPARSPIAPGTTQNANMLRAGLHPAHTSPAAQVARGLSGRAEVLLLSRQSAMAISAVPPSVQRLYDFRGNPQNHFVYSFTPDSEPRAGQTSQPPVFDRQHPSRQRSHETPLSQRTSQPHSTQPQSIQAQPPLSQLSRPARDILLQDTGTFCPLTGKPLYSPRDGRFRNVRGVDGSDPYYYSEHQSLMLRIGDQEAADRVREENRPFYEQMRPDPLDQICEQTEELVRQISDAAERDRLFPDVRRQVALGLEYTRECEAEWQQRGLPLQASASTPEEAVDEIGGGGCRVGDVETEVEETGVQLATQRSYDDAQQAIQSQEVQWIKNNFQQAVNQTNEANPLAAPRTDNIVHPANAREMERLRRNRDAEAVRASNAASAQHENGHQQHRSQHSFESQSSGHTARRTVENPQTMRSEQSPPDISRLESEGQARNKRKADEMQPESDNGPSDKSSEHKKRRRGGR